MNTKDPINGLINYVNEIKPYHSKIIEVLTGYVYTEAVDVSISERMTASFGLVVPRYILDATLKDAYFGTYGVGPYDSFKVLPVISMNESLIDGAFDAEYPTYNTDNNSVAIPADQTLVFRVGRTVILDVYKVDITDGSRTDEQSPPLTYTISDSVVAPDGQIDGVINNPMTVLTFEEALPDLESVLGTLDANERYNVTVGILPLPIDSVIAGYDNAGIGGFVNAIVMDGDVQSNYPFGVKLSLMLSNGDVIDLSAIHTFYDESSDKTAIRVLESLDPSNDYTDAEVIEKFYGLDEVYIKASSSQNPTNLAEGLVETAVSERLTISWTEGSDSGEIKVK